MVVMKIFLGSALFCLVSEGIVGTDLRALADYRVAQSMKRSQNFEADSRLFLSAGGSAKKNSCASERLNGWGMCRKKISAVRRCWIRSDFMPKKYFSAGERYSARAEAGAKRTSAHRRLLGVGVK